MTVREFVRLEKSGCMFRIVDANKPGYMSRNIEELTADRNVMISYYGNCELVGFEPYSKRIITIYAKLNAEVE